MRFRITLQKKEIERIAMIPLNYQYPISSWIYHVIQTSDSDFSHWLHSEGKRYETRVFKHFTFSQLSGAKGWYTIADDRMLVNHRQIYLTVSFNLPEIVEHFIKGIFMDTECRLFDKKSEASFQVRNIERLPDPEFSSNMAFKTLSQILLSKPADETREHELYLSPVDKDYEFYLKQNLIGKYNSLFPESPINEDFDFKFTLLNKARKKGIKIKDGRKDGTQVIPYFFQFRIEAPIELIKTAYFSGFGKISSQGLGCVEVMR